MGFLSLMLVVSSSWAQSGRRLHYCTLFNPGTVGAVSGEVVRVEHAFAGNGADYCVHALLQTPKGQVTAILAPKGYLAEQGLSVAPQDRLTVTGSLISILGKPFILAMKVEGDRTMHLREASGRPAWAEGEDWHVGSTLRQGKKIVKVTLANLSHLPPHRIEMLRRVLKGELDELAGAKTPAAWSKAPPSRPCLRPRPCVSVSALLRP